jgi:hypothetical protein
MQPFNKEHEGSGDLLVARLNQWKKTSPADYGRLTQIMRDIRSLETGNSDLLCEEDKQALVKAGVPRRFIDGDRPVSDSGVVRVFALTRLNLRLKEYLCYPGIRESFPPKPRLFVSWRSPTPIGAMVHLIVSLFEFNLLRRVRQCEQCGLWFYASRNARKFCRPSCSKLNWQASEIGKQQRRGYMRKYMQKYRKESI